MKTIISILVACNLVVCVVYVFGIEADKQSVSSERNVPDESVFSEVFFWENCQRYTVIRNSDIVRTPLWFSDERVVLPLTPEQACVLAREKLHLYVTRTNNYDVSSILLRRYMAKDQWFYRVGFRCYSQELTNNLVRNLEWMTADQEFHLFVLMSGRVLDVRCRPVYRGRSLDR